MKPTTPVKSNHQPPRNCRRGEQTARALAKAGNEGFPATRTTGSEASRGSWRVSRASTGDHPLIHQFLVSMFHGPSPLEFQMQLEEPSYEPRDRLLIKDEGRIAGHVRLLKRDMRLGDLVLPVGLITDLATRPEYQGQGCTNALLSAACQRLAQEGAVLALLATDQPHFYARRGWVVNGRHCYSASAPRQILSYLKQREAEASGLLGPLQTPQGHPRYNIRLWRHVERVPVMRLHEESTRASYGSFVRSEAYWRWLLSRWGKQRIYIAIDGPDGLAMDQSLSPIVAYAAARDGRVVELVCSVAHPEAAVQLLARVCQDAIEQDFGRIRLDAPPHEPLHAVMVRAGGEHQYSEADQGVVHMAHLLQPRRFLNMMSERLLRRADEAGLPKPCQLGLLVDKKKYQLSLDQRGLNLTAGPLGRSYLGCAPSLVPQLLLGHVDVRDAVASGRAKPSTRVALETAKTLFPYRPLWHPPWDRLSAD